MRLFYASTDRYNRRCCARDSLALQGEADADGKTNQNSRSRHCKVSRPGGLPQCRRSWQRRSRPQSTAKHRHVAAILHRISGWFSKTSTRCGSPPRPALGDCQVHSWPCAHPIRHVISPIRPVTLNEALCRPSGTTLDIVHAERRVADHRANIGS